MPLDPQAKLLFEKLQAMPTSHRVTADFDLLRAPLSV